MHSMSATLYSWQLKVEGDQVAFDIAGSDFIDDRFIRKDISIRNKNCLWIECQL